MAGLPGGGSPSSNFHNQLSPPTLWMVGPYPLQSAKGPRLPISWLLTMTRPGLSAWRSS